MKKLAIALCLTASVLSAMAQGTINFNNRVTAAGVNAPVTFGGTGIDSSYWGQLFVMNGASYEAVGSPVAFRDGAAVGYINGGEVQIASVAPGANATLVLRAWASASGSDWGSASSNPTGIFGESNVITVKTGGDGAPPAVPGNLVGLQGFALAQVPEPSTIALGLIGLAALAIRRRK